jgi:hypothetical protein
LYVLIGIGILVLASFVIAFLSARTWHWGHVIVVLGIFLSTLGFLLLSAEVLRINGVLRKEYQRVEGELADAKARGAAVVEGTTDGKIIAQLAAQDPPLAMPENAESIPSMAELDHELLLQLRVRGRVWRNLKPAAPFDPKTDQIKVAFQAPPGLTKDTVVYLFEEPVIPAATAAPADGSPQPAPPPLPVGRRGQYLGEFRVQDVAGPQATLVSARPMDDFERQRVAKSQMSWSIYETMPVDRHEIFAADAAADPAQWEAQLKQLLPAEVVNEYIRDGKEAAANDPAERQVGRDAEGVRLPADKLGEAAKKEYSRRIRDYATEFDELTRQRVELTTEIAGLKQDIARLEAADKNGKQLLADREVEKKKLVGELANVSKELTAIKTHLSQVEGQLAKVRQLLAETLKRNREMARELSTAERGARRPGGGAARPAASNVPLALGATK